ncbi:MAG: hypothetical protein IJH84_09615 [Saccharopolyspora sp.]|uniref:hypothetical protein n=1 Tax=Saccharopolyspora sp. TaxID=33915 RepID=UPI0025F9283D|nr:hypothetical protein [Saccharopolyspora sp.]MBQ1543579.1 hypothetical protein [Caulobacteraceae bacterium]MBQ6641277.1 hypothetical protein [Saccharopolyspora sp.]
MSCDVALAAFLWLASTGPAAAAPKPAVAVAVAAPQSVAKEPLFADIVGRAGRLKAEVEAWRGHLKADGPAASLTGFDAFSARIGELAALDQKGHEVLKARGTDGDLKCILHGISQDLPLKLGEIGKAATGKDQDAALRDMAYLLNDNVEVITAPPAPAV